MTPAERLRSLPRGAVESVVAKLRMDAENARDDCDYAHRRRDPDLARLFDGDRAANDAIADLVEAALRGEP